MENINLVNDAWIPVKLSSGEMEKVSLNTIFSDFEGNIVDLTVVATERIALMRLFLCICYAAGFTGEGNKSDFEKCTEYLKKWENFFNLFDEKYPFLQYEGLKSEKEKSWKKICFGRASGKNVTFRDNDPDNEKIESSELALNLLVFQNFHGNGAVGTGFWKEVNITSQAGGKSGLCRNSLHTFILKENLLNTIKANFIPRDHLPNLYRHDEESFGRPYWENYPQKSFDDRAAGNASESFLGLLVPWSRGVLLKKDGTAFVVKGLETKFKHEITQDKKCALEYRQITTTILNEKKGKNENAQVFKVKKDKALWREIHSILQARLPGHRDGENVLMPLTVENFIEKNESNFIVWSGGLIGEDQKEEAYVESSWPIFEGTLEDNACSRQKFIDYADKVSNNLKAALVKYSNSKDPLVKKVLGNYWGCLEAEQAYMNDLIHKYVNGKEESLETWKIYLNKIARKIFDDECVPQTGPKWKDYAAAIKEFYV